MISNKNIKSVKITNKLHKKSSVYLNRLLKLAPHIKRFDPQLGSSPAYITVPIANKGLVSYIYETEASYSKTVKQNYADNILKLWIKLIYLFSFNFYFFLFQGIIATISLDTHLLRLSDHKVYHGKIKITL